MSAQRKGKEPCNEELSLCRNATIDLFDGVMLPARSHDKISVLAKTESCPLGDRPQPDWETGPCQIGDRPQPDLGTDPCGELPFGS